MLFAGWEVRMVKNCDRGCGLGQHFLSRGHSFSPYGLTVSRQITCLFFFSYNKLVLQITNGFVDATLVIESTCTASTNDL